LAFFILDRGTMFTVYALKSISYNFIYVGMTENLEERLLTHHTQLMKIWSNGVMELTGFSHYSNIPLLLTRINRKSQKANTKKQSSFESLHF